VSKVHHGEIGLGANDKQGKARLLSQIARLEPREWTLLCEGIDWAIQGPKGRRTEGNAGPN
jgi:hypothetical protein